MEMSETNTVLLLLSHWWAFGQPMTLPIPVADRPQRVYLDAIDRKRESTFFDRARLIGWHFNSNPLDAHKARLVLNRHKKSYLDQWIETVFSEDDCLLFEHALRDTQTLYAVKLDSGLTLLGTLAELCWYRFYQLLSLQPNPLLFSRDTLADERSNAGKVDAVCDVKFLLPTRTGIRYRSHVLSQASGIALDPQRLMLFASLLPEFFGTFRLSAKSKRANSSAPLYTGGAGTVRGGRLKPFQGRRCVATGQIVMLILSLPSLFAIRLVRRFIRFNGKSGLRVQGVEKRLIGPKSAKGLWERPEWRAMTEFAHSLEQRGAAYG